VHRALSIMRSARFAAPLACGPAVACVREDTGLDFSRARARVGFARGHLLEVVVYLPGGSGNRIETDAAEDLVRLLVGEELFERWVGTVRATPTVRGGPLQVLNENAEERAALQIETLPDTVRAAIAGLKAGLQELPLAHATDSEDWFAFELSPEPAADYAAQDDLVFCSTRLPELKKCFLRGELFFSGRFTNSGALYTYLKYDSAETTTEARIAERSKFEDAIKRTVREEYVGVVGLGLGVRYAYIDLAVTDPNCVQLLLPELRALGIPKRSWLLFCDSELEAEYLPVYADSPAPFRG